MDTKEAVEALMDTEFNPDAEMKCGITMVRTSPYMMRKLYTQLKCTDGFGDNAEWVLLANGCLDAPLYIPGGGWCTGHDENCIYQRMAMRGGYVPS